MYSESSFRDLGREMLPASGLPCLRGRKNFKLASWYVSFHLFSSWSFPGLSSSFLCKIFGPVCAIFPFNVRSLGCHSLSSVEHMTPSVGVLSRSWAFASSLFDVWNDLTPSIFCLSSKSWLRTVARRFPRGVSSHFLRGVASRNTVRCHRDGYGWCPSLLFLVNCLVLFGMKERALVPFVVHSFLRERSILGDASTPGVHKLSLTCLFAGRNSK